MKLFPLSALALAAVFSGSASAGLVVDGNLSDWQIDRNTWASALPGVYSTVEDATGSGTYYLNPGWGGQAYDAEALYATFQDGRLFIALATGHDPLTSNNPGANRFAAGDFAIDFGKDGIYELGINVVNNFARGTLGGVYANPTWAYGLWDANGNDLSRDPKKDQKVDKTHPTSLTGGQLLGNALFSYTTTGVSGYGSRATDTHYFYELSLDLGLLRAAGWDGSSFNIHWTENCANDNILTDPAQSVPEPGSLALVGVGMIGLLGGGVRRRPGRKALEN